MNEKVPSANIAFLENKLSEMFAAAGLHLAEKIDGNWKGNQPANQLRDFQYIFVLEKA